MAKRPDAQTERVAPTREKPKQVADELRRLIIDGTLTEGDSLGTELELIGRFGVSRPSLREALRILEAEGLVSIVRGVSGGVVVHRPDQRMTARTVALVLQARNVPLGDVLAARAIIEPAAARVVASSRSHQRSALQLRAIVAEQEHNLDDPTAFNLASLRLHAELVALTGNQTLIIVSEMLGEVTMRAMRAAVDRVDTEPVRTRRRAMRSQEKIVTLIDAGDADGAEAHWRNHLAAARRLLGRNASSVVEHTNHL
jgi:DNA-binding FadR family transcriptional regulator